MKNEYSILVGKPERKKSLGKYGVKLSGKLGGVVWIQLISIRLVTSRWLLYALSAAFGCHMWLGIF
jgi:hypothetical protein